MAEENNRGTLQIVIQEGEDREWLLEDSSEPKPWIDQVISISESREYSKRKTSAYVCIYRVPEFIKNTKRAAYDPRVVCLGPYHHKKHQQVTAMDEFKLQAIDRTLERLPGMTIEMLLNKVEGIMKNIRDCYEDSAIEWDDIPLAWMMTMDACFVLEFLQMELLDSSLVFCPRRSDNIKRREIVLDIMKLENQIPFCVLQTILELETKDAGAVPAFLAKKLDGLVGGFFGGHPFSLEENEDVKAESCSNRGRENENVIAKLIKGGVSHLLDLSRQVIANLLSNSDSRCGHDMPIKCCACNFHCGGSTCIATPSGVACFRGPNRTSSSVDGSMIPSAEKLQSAGIKLKRSTRRNFHFKRRRFRRSSLYLPQIIVEDDTEIFLRNLVAYEECQRQENSQIKRVISRIMYVMDNLIDSKEDVVLFRRANIIKNYLGTDEEVARIFNDLCIGITYKDDFKEVLKDVNEHYNSELEVWITEFRKQHCSKPWYIISLVAAVILLALTLLQTIYTMKS